MQSAAKLLPYARTVDAKSNEVSIVKPGELVDVVEMTPLTLADRRVYNLMLANAWDDILEDKVHQIPKSALLSAENKHRGTERLDDSIERLMSSIVQIRKWQNGEWDTIHVALLGANTVPDRTSGMVRYRFDEELRKVIAESTVFARLQKQIMFKLSSKYALSLYEILQKRCNLSRRNEDFTLEELRGYLGVPPKKLSSWINLKNKAITPALSEVSNLSDFRVWIDPITIKKKIVGVTLNWERKTPGENIQAGQTALPSTTDAGAAAVIDDPAPTLFELPVPTGSGLSIRTDIREKAKKLIPGYDIYFVEAEWKNWVSATGKPAPTSPDGAFLAFCKTYAKNNPL